MSKMLLRYLDGWMGGWIDSDGMDTRVFGS